MLNPWTSKGSPVAGKYLLPALIVLLSPQGVLAQGFCAAPVAPQPVNGAEATPEQLRQAVADARNFIGQANLYENCLREQLQAARARAAAGAGPEQDLEKDTALRIAANRRLKDKVSSQAAGAMDAYKKAHAD
jgi:hypothetical protein